MAEKKVRERERERKKEASFKETNRMRKAKNTHNTLY